MRHQHNWQRLNKIKGDKLRYSQSIAPNKQHNKGRQLMQQVIGADKIDLIINRPKPGAA